MRRTSPVKSFLIDDFGAYAANRLLRSQEKLWSLMGLPHAGLHGNFARARRLPGSGKIEQN
jgi:hypothetical protein